MSIQDQNLIYSAIQQLDKAYAPYSNFQVGSAAILTNGEVFYGANQENASYPLCMCSERIALYCAAMTFPTVAVQTIAIVAKNLKKKLDHIISPCGACRQVISEFEDRHQHPIRLLLHVDGLGIHEIAQSDDMLPYRFSGSSL